MAAVIFNATAVQALKPGIKLFDQATIYSGTANPTSTATAGTIGDLFIRTGTPNVYQKITTSTTDTNWRLISAGVSAGDISETSFSLANNQAAAADVTNLAFANASVRAVEVFYSVTIDATSDLFEAGKLTLIQRGADWQMTQTFAGDDSLIDFTITTAGQVQYVSPSYAGFVSATMKFRAISLGT